MATFPTSPSLPAVTTATECDPDFFNTFVDNINAMGDALIALIGGTADGNIDIAVDKGIMWAGALEIYFSGGDIIIDDSVQITGDLAITGTLSAGTVTLPANIDVSGILTVDTIDDSGAGQITINEHLEMATGKGIQGTGGTAIAVNAGMNVTGSVDVTGTLSVDTINDSGGAKIVVNETLDLAANKGVEGQFVTVNTISLLSASYISLNDSLYQDSGKYIRTTELQVDTIDTAWTSAITIEDDVEITAGNTLKVGTQPNYTISNVNVDRSFDADTVAIAELADVVGTIINDLIAIGLFT